MQIAVAKRLEQTEEYYFSKKLREIESLNKAGKKIINLAIGSPDLPPHPSVVEELVKQAALDTTHGYQSYKGSVLLRQAIADWYQRYYQVNVDAATEVLPLMGSKEGIMHICMTYLQAGDKVLIPNPGYPTYASAVRLSEATAIPYTLSESNNWLPDLQALEKNGLQDVKMMWINYPHMPTGARATKAFFEAIIAFGKKHHILICHDNPYSFILNEEPMSIMAVEGAKDVAIELNSLSKSANMAGWRLGMLVAHPDRIDEILRFKSNMDSGMFFPLQAAAAVALSLDQSWYDELNTTYRERREKVFSIMDLLGCSYQKDQVGLFVWAKVPDEIKDAYALTDKVLYDANVFITPGGIFGEAGSQYIRISLCATVETFDQAIGRIQTLTTNS
ncbi:aminotransferase class I/II-fold pyridoxal phosphate-dependent enzyme [Sphingobacterium sp. lm-10]|uniref:pyridoxal phosphate-dependent aminotransferase n=1 Tax=Sphingobacterium sp. lm-10 TaxID=2944904 RepID=UPI0020210C66|nr:aminotransferase class I/II-fold pyridoxal phosphate-dependent enzyme [Sphingobacterium sp. lm-10]MCL7987188.1 aminotransferase class I/II-fold pyridoxal phosphate-dependent enzyme [Sphingobacterium sp. lm-10]